MNNQKLSRRLLFLLICSISYEYSFGQILGGGTTFATAVTFNQSWLVGCPSGGVSLCNTAACEPTTAMDACGGAPSCATGTTGSDVWFKFFAQSATTSITVNSTSAFDIAIQAFSGSTCGGLTQIGCADLQGNNQPETVNLTGLTAGTEYYFRIFGATNAVGARTGNYNFCGSTGLGSSALPVAVSSLKLTTNNNKQCISWVTDGERDIEEYQVEYSNDGILFTTIGSVAATNNAATHSYEFCDAVSRTKGLYRIKTIEQSGQTKFSYSIRIQSSAFKTARLYPAPVTDIVHIELPGDERDISYTIINSFGQTEQTGKLNENRTVNVHMLKSGAYFIRLTSKEFIQTVQFTKN